MDSLLDGYDETLHQKTDTVSLLDGYIEPINEKKGVPVKIGAKKDIQMPVQAQQNIVTQQEEMPEAGFAPMAGRIGSAAWNGLLNLPYALLDFAKQSVDAGKKEFSAGYNPLGTIGSSAIGAFQGAGNLLEGIYNIPGDLTNAYYGYEKAKITHPLTQGIPYLLNQTTWGRNYLQDVNDLTQQYPLANMLFQEVGEELPGMVLGATTAKLGMKAGKIAKTADKLSDVGYGKLVRHSAVGGLADGLVVDPAQAQEFNMTPQERLQSRFTNAYSGAVIAPTLNIGTKATVEGVPKVANRVKEAAPKIADFTKATSAQVFSKGKELYNSANKALNENAFDNMMSLSKDSNFHNNSLLENYVPPSKRVEEIAPKIVEKQNIKKSKKIGVKSEVPDEPSNQIVNKLNNKKKRLTKRDIENENLKKILDDISDVPESQIEEITEPLKKYWIELRNLYGHSDSISKLHSSVKGYQKADLKPGDFYYSILDPNNKYEIIDIDGERIERNISNGNMPRKKMLKAEYAAGHYRKFIPENEETIKNSFNLNKELAKKITDDVRQSISKEKELKSNITPEIINNYKAKFDGIVDIVPSDINQGQHEILHDNENSTYIDNTELYTVGKTPIDKKSLYPDHETASLYRNEDDTEFTLKFRKNLTKREGMHPLLTDTVGERNFTSFDEAYNFIKKHNINVLNLDSYKNRKSINEIAPQTFKKQKKAKKQGVINWAKKEDDTAKLTNETKTAQKTENSSESTVKPDIIEEVKKEGDLNGFIQKSDRIRPDEIKEKGRIRKVRRRKSGIDESVSHIGRNDNIPSNGRGLNPEHEEIIKASYKNQHALNEAIKKFITDKEYEKYSNNLPDDLRAWLKKYSGAGGLEKQGAEGRGLLSEFYTPDDIVKKMWELTANHINIDGSKVLEPSLGIGRFFDYAPKNVKLHGIEMNSISGKIAQLLYPEADIKIAEFQEQFIDKSKNLPVKKVTPQYDIVIGNPPYGKYSGRYAGLGEGKNAGRVEYYFIKRGLDLLNDDGILTYVIPSSFLKGEITKIQSEISNNAVLLDAYRLPEKTFNTTDTGTDIIVLKKQKNADKSLFSFDTWFKKHPEKILGETLTRKNRFGKEETYVKKTSSEALTSSKNNVAAPEKIYKSSANKIKPEKKLVKGNVEYEAYTPEIDMDEKEYQLFADTLVDGTLPKVKYSPDENVNQYKGQLYNDFNYLQGDIYDKLDSLEHENISSEQKEIQRKKLLSVLPKPKEVNEIKISPTSEFIQELSFGDIEHKYYNYSKGQDEIEISHDTLDKRFKDYVEDLSSSERNNISRFTINNYIDGDRVSFKTYGTDEQKKASKVEQLTRLKNTVDDLFSQFIETKLTKDEKEKLKSAWNRKFNAIHNPDYLKVPLIVENLNSKFYGNDLKLLNVQKEGINFLTNKGVGLLGFEVGVGKTLTGIVATVQSMQMGRTKRPLILAPKQVKDNWIREINQLFPNIKVNDIGNLSNFKGKIEDGTISIGTYEALANIWYEGETINNSDGTVTRTGYLRELIDKLYDISTDFNKESTKRAREAQLEDVEKLVGLAEKGNKKLYTIDELGFDHITVDEAHNFRNLFKQARAYGRENNAYQNVGGGGMPSSRASRLFLLTQSILDKNNNRNVFMLTATPFNNSPLEVFNMLSFIGKDSLDKMGLYNIYQFMEHYAELSADWVVKSNNDVKYDQVVKAFKNAGSLRELIKSLMLIRSADDAGVKRPNKHVDKLILEPSNEQLNLIAKYEAEALGHYQNEDGEVIIKKPDDGAVLKAINQARQVTLSPDIATKNFDVSPDDFVANSPKLEYISRAVAEMKKKDSSTSQLIYMPLGLEFIPKLKQYFIEKNIYKPDEIEIISSETKDDNIPKITDSFNDAKGKVKLIIGTQRIKEGMNLNKNTSVLYIPFVDWNPTDFIQVVGRIWRQGNKYKDVKIVVPLLKNSSDSFMFQKLDEKTSRINNIMDESQEYIETGELNTAEEKLNMITLPDKKAQMFSAMEVQKLENEEVKLKGRLETAEHYKTRLLNAQQNLRYTKDQIEALEEKKKKAVDENSLETIKSLLDKAKKDTKKDEQHLQFIEKSIKKLELDLEVKDTKEAINKQLEALKLKKEQIKELTNKKLIEYQEKYYKDNLNKKSIDSHINDFKKSLDDLYGSQKEEVFDSLPLEELPYNKTSEKAYSSPVKKIIQTKAQKTAKIRKKERLEKLKNLTDVSDYKKFAKESIRKWASDLDLRRYEVNKKLNSFINITRSIAKELKTNDKKIREIMPFLRERTNIPDRLERPDLKELWNRLSSGQKNRLRKLADDVSEKFDVYWEEYVGTNADESVDMSKYAIENHISHIWKLDKNKKSLLTNYFATKSRFAKQRSIKTLFDGINGIEAPNGEIVYFEPKTLDYAEILKTQSDSLIKAIVDKQLADKIKNMKTTDGLGLVLPSNQAPLNWVELDHPALNKTIAVPFGKSEFKETISPELQNILADMGIAIGRRLPKFKRSGELNSYGKYIHKEPPEIKLQRWFSNKTLAHEIGHALDKALDLSKNNFAQKYKNELIKLNKNRIDKAKRANKEKYATNNEELIAEFFAHFFNDISNTYNKAPKATAEAIRLITENKKLEKLLPNNFDWQNAKHVLETKTLQFFKSKVKVHPDIADILNNVFEKQGEPTLIGKFYDNINSTLKYYNLGFSGFHAVALTEAALANLGIKETVKIINPVRIFRAIKNNEWDIYNNDTLAKFAIRHGLQLGATLDIHRKHAENLMDNTATWAENNIPVIGKPLSLLPKTISVAQKLNNKVLWNYLHNNYKLATFYKFVQEEAKYGAVSEAKLREIAQWANDSFGGQVQENLGIKPSGRKWEQRIFLSPDWLRSTTRQFVAMVNTESVGKVIHQKSSNTFWKKAKEIANQWGIGDLTGDVEASGMRGRIARRFWIRAMIQFALYSNILNAYFREKDRKENPELYPEKMSFKDYSTSGNSKGNETYIFIGRNSDGTERYWRLGKQFREVPEIVHEPLKKIGGKMSPALQLLSQTFTGHTLSGFKNREITDSKGLAKAGAVAKMWAASPMPYSMSSLFNPYKDVSVADFFAGTSKGMTFSKGRELMIDAIKNKDKKEIQQISRDLRRNKVNPDDVVKSAIKEIRKKAFSKAVQKAKQK